jgi:hypothetical protein
MAAPIRRAATTNTGISRSETAVTCQEIPIITAKVSASVTALDTTPDSVSEKARWAPITSLPSRLTRAPVRVRVKNATGIRCTWSKTAVRRSRIRPSPMVDDSHLVISDTVASATATPAITTASNTTVAGGPPCTIALTTLPASIGVATVSSALSTLIATNAPSLR